MSAAPKRGEAGPRLAAYTTFKLGGPCRGLVTCSNRRELVQALRDLNEVGEAFTLIGGGSNLLVSDQGLDQVVIRYYSEKPQLARDGNNLVVQGSTLLDDFVGFTVQEGLDGMVSCSGIPGTVGGAIAGNAGAFGEQIGDHLVSATLVDRAGNEWEVNRDDLEFAYRTSRLQRTEAFLAAARFRLKPGQRCGLSDRKSCNCGPASIRTGSGFPPRAAFSRTSSPPPRRSAARPQAGSWSRRARNRCVWAGPAPSTNTPTSSSRNLVAPPRMYTNWRCSWPPWSRLVLVSTCSPKCAAWVIFPVCRWRGCTGRSGSGPVHLTPSEFWVC
jgi:UDP-N-acetylenolpyruvoylglucosamine reductase